MGGWKKKAASSNQQREYSHCTRCHVAKHGNDRKFHYIKTVRGALPPHLSRGRRLLPGGMARLSPCCWRLMAATVMSTL